MTNFTANYDAQTILENPSAIDEIFDFIEDEALEELKTQNISVGNTYYSVSEEYIEEELKPTLDNSRMFYCALKYNLLDMIMLIIALSYRCS